jgi:hypothetical protein
MNLLPLNQILWTVLIALLAAGAGWIMVILTARLEREYQKIHGEWIVEPKSSPLPQWARIIRSWLLPGGTL